MLSKYTNAIPLYRISQDMQRRNLILSRATMGNWVIRCAEQYLSMAYDRLHEHRYQQDIIQVDETSYHVTKDGRDGVNNSYMFVYRTSELRKKKPVILYKYEKTMSGKLASAFLKGFSGVLESDAISGYKALDKSADIIRAAFCWACSTGFC